jgi:hypothetical protein
MMGWLAGWLAGRLIRWLVQAAAMDKQDWQAGWLAGWLAEPILLQADSAWHCTCKLFSQGIPYASALIHLYN